MDYRSGKKQRRERALRGQGSTGGFSMAETLATVAIIVILLALAVVGIFNLYYSLQQKELDSKAEIIYVAAQDQMTKIMAAGQRDFMQPGTGDNYATKIDGIPGDAWPMPEEGEEVDSTKNYVEEGSLAYLTSDQLRIQLDNDKTNAAKVLFANGALDQELLNENWIIEYDYTSLTVYSVFFNPDDDSFVSKYAQSINDASSTGKYDPYRVYSGRLKSLKGQLDSPSLNNVRVGYHGGAGSGSGSESYPLQPFVAVNNDEKLTATITCVKSPLVAEDLVFKVTVSDNFGHSYIKYYGYRTNDLGSNNKNPQGYEVCHDYPNVGNEDPSQNVGKLCKQGTLYTLKLNLDSLESADQRFTNLYGSGHKTSAGAIIDNNVPGKQQLVEGSDIKVRVDVSCKGNRYVMTNHSESSGNDNSLFDNETNVNPNAQENTAKISLGRHLQNLDSTSGVSHSASIGSGSAHIASAELFGAVNFTQDDKSLSQTEARDWYKVYSSGYFNKTTDSGIPVFKPIVNGELKSFDGKSLKISHLYVREKLGGTGNPAGLFGTVSGGQQLSIANTNLSGAFALGGNAGAFVGSVSGTGSSVKLASCQSYLEGEDRNGADKLAKAWLQGTTVGGLVGGVTSGASLSIDKSSASSVIGFLDGKEAENTVIGGLVGSFTSNGTLNITSSYADSYLLGDTVGGLVGSASTEEASGTAADGRVSGSYAAGFIASRASDHGRQGAGILASGGLKGGVDNSYIICDKLTHGVENYSSNFSYAPTVPSGKGTGLANVYYMSNGSIPTDDEAGGVQVSDSVSSAQTIASNTNASFDFKQESTPYNLLKNGLTTYTWPTVPGLKHYGDWSAGFKAGTLVYYEKYIDQSKPAASRVSYGFEGANVVSTLKNQGRSNNSKLAVVGDGYGIVFDKNQEGAIPDELAVAVTNPDDGGSVCDQTIDTKNSSTEKYEVDGYVVYPLSKPDIVNTSATNGKSYYLIANIKYSLGSASYDSSYYFNPHFARSVKEQVTSSEDGANVPSVDDEISIRTARQLHNLSLYYSKYSEVTANKTFGQERNIDYSEYEWTDFASTPKAISSQKPIGRDHKDEKPFVAKYDGHCFEITDVSFVEDGKDASPYVGMFGNINDRSAEIKNVVLVTDYKAGSNKNFYVQYSGETSTGNTLHLGILAGRNAGKISNCAVAGYYVAGKDGTVHAYTDTTVNLGGLVGTNTNTGSITKSSADVPRLRLSSTFATSRVGGFVGNNAGEIKNSYSIGAVDLADARGGSANIAGFAGRNNARISSSYAAVALTLSGENASSYGFAPKGGSVSGCTYLNGGTYVYVGTMYSHNFDTSKSSASPVSYSNLKQAAKKGRVSKANSLYHSNTNETSYPFAGKVTNASDVRVHYGDWQTEVTLGTLGAFYWEHEEGGNNSGYHMAYLGSDVSVSGSSAKSKLAQGTSLCTSHDDDGVIDSYGYGFYTVTGETVSATWKDIACSSGINVDDVSNVTRLNKEASDSLKEQMEATSGNENIQYNFYAFTTRTEADAAGSDYITLGSKTAQNGELKLAHTAGAGTSETKTNYTFAISPFFANSLQLVGNKNGQDNNPEKLLAEAAANPSEASDGALKDYTLDLGKSESAVSGEKQEPGNAYEIRSVQQLQYLNWNSTSKSTDELVSKDNRSQFNYLLYAKVTSKQETKNVDTLAPESKYKTNLHWVQTHDAASPDSSKTFAPIAGTATSSSPTSYEAVLYAWFGSTFNGQSYTIKDVSIVSPSFNVGLFGVTVGANIRNVVMYGSKGSAITRATEGEYASKSGAYTIGGLVGIAFEYTVNNKNIKDSGNYIENCAISGYTIEDKSSNEQGLGEANVGGLIGVANVNLRKCSADVAINEQATLNNGVAQYGVYIRVGGLAGGAQGNIEDCYSGGSFDFKDGIANNANLDMRYLKDDGTYASVSYNSDKTKSDKRFWICVGGIAGSAFTSNFINLTGVGNTSDGKPVLTNCYTYFEFPDKMMSTDISGLDQRLIMSTVASLADRSESTYASSADLTLNNCYFYSAIQNQHVEVQHRGIYDTKPRVNPSSIDYETMTLPKDNKDSLIAKLNSYSSSSDNPWDAVSSVDASGASIDGKFSFPSNDLSLLGKNYPFPTVVTQNDLTFGTFDKPVPVHVHYGNWPKVNTSYWAEGRATMDIFSDMADDKWAYHDFALYVNNADFKKATAPTKDDFIVSRNDTDGAVATVDSVRSDNSDVSGLSKYIVRVKALREGMTTITLAEGGDPNKASGAVFSLQVTANLQLSAKEQRAAGDDGSFNASTNTLTLENEKAMTLKLEASSIAARAGDHVKDYSVSGDSSNPNPAWTFEVTEGVQSLLSFDPDTSASPTGSNLLRITRKGAGKLLVNIKNTYDYNSVSLVNDMYITVADLAPIGLSNGEVFNEVKAAEPNGLHGTDKAYASDKAPTYTGSPLYLYTSAAGDFFDNGFSASSITIDGDSYSDGVFNEKKRYFISINDAVVQPSGSEYKFVPITLTYNGDSNKPASDVSVTIRLENGPELTVSVPKDKIKKTETVNLDFVDGASPNSTKTLAWPKGYVYTLPSYTGCFPSAKEALFDGWGLDGSDEYYSPDDEILVEKAMTFRSGVKHVLTLAAKGGDKSVEYYVGRNGIGSLSEYDDKVLQGAFDNTAFTDWYDGDNDKDSIVVTHDGQFKKNNIPSFADGKGRIIDGVLFLTGDVTLYTQCVRWELANALEDGAEYIVLNRNSATGNNGLATSAILGSSSLLARTGTDKDPNEKIYLTGVSKPNISIDSKKGKIFVSQPMSDESVFVAEEDSKCAYLLNGISASKSMFYLKNKESNLYLSDAGYRGDSSMGLTSNDWYIGGIGKVENNYLFAVGNGYTDFDPKYRSVFNVADSTGHFLYGFNKPRNGYPILFRKDRNTGTMISMVTAENLDSGIHENAYLYKKTVSFDW